MAKHNDKEFQKKLQLTFRDKLYDQFRGGLAQGMYAACKTILSRATDETKTQEERLQNVIAFCEPIMNANSPKKPGTAKAGE